MFDHPLIQIYAFEDTPLDRDLKLIDEKWMVEFEAALIKSVDESGESAYSVGYYSPAAASAIDSESMELAWYPNTHDRFHQVRISLPRSAFVTCVGSWQYDYDPLIFVRGDWLTNLHLRSHSVFALIDAINVKKALASGTLTRVKLIELRDRIDEISSGNPTVAFMSFADSLLLKSNYSVGQYDSNIKYTYEPEKIIRLLPDVRAAYQRVLGLDIYAVITQGSNEYYNDDLLHISSTHNHISFNSLGLPFAQTQAIEHCARAALRTGIHPAADVYLEENFYHSLRFRREFAKNNEPKFLYKSPMVTGKSYYFPMSLQKLTDNLERLK
ncbi:hypothetical protein [Methylocapsa aurea]|uniref:hypothetical protein n=1 Tax=Methylocapsa aurea TaxID=663610 RepID=UPI0012EB3FCC|nr:hypothetical protein [Methylocapsa aurea]